MIKIHKLFLKNFKGVQKKTVIDFSSASLTILDGPNGFGKTTIFDAIEICLRGKLERTVSYDHVTKKNADHIKPFYQNVKGDDVLLKLWLKDDVKSLDHIIYKFLPRDHDGKLGSTRAFRPDNWGILSSFYGNQVAEFEIKENIDGLEAAEQSFFDQLFFDQANLSLVNLFPLFNYLQQEENIYFLKKDEEKKKNELDFLFQTQQEAQKLEKLDSFLRNLRGCKQDIVNRLASLGELMGVNTTLPYRRIFTEKALLFDIEFPFREMRTDVLTNNYERYLAELDDIIVFRKNFDPEEFEKNKLKDSLLRVAQEPRLQSAFVLQSLFEEEVYARLTAANNNIKLYREWNKKLNDQTLSNSDVLAMGFDTNFVDAMVQLLSQKATLEKHIGELGKIIVDLNHSRESVMEDYSKLIAASAPDSNCPLCNSQYQSMESLTIAVGEKTDLLRSVNRTQIVQLEQLNEEIKREVTEKITQRLNELEKQPENKMDTSTFDLAAQYKDFREVIYRFNDVLSKHSLNLSRFHATADSTLDEVRSLIDNLGIELNRLAMDISVAEEKLIGRHWYKDLFGENAEFLAILSLNDLTEKRNYLQQEYTNAKFTSINLLQRRLESFQAIENKAKHIRDTLDKSIKKYKLEMVDKIKIPFYVFSGKIIQNYQQGFGIFIDMDEKTNRVRFLTDTQSDHDIVHHLSSGQLAVVSIAFCLALNKVYNTTNNFKFLAIDDPVQTLDDINVHSLIELMRHDFKSYQILISTHEENIASYMDYKFKKFGFNCERKRVQKIFYANTDNGQISGAN